MLMGAGRGSGVRVGGGWSLIFFGGAGGCQKKGLQILDFHRLASLCLGLGDKGNQGRQFKII